MTHPTLNFESHFGELYSGRWRPGRGGTEPVRDVATGAEIGSIGLADEDDVEEAGARAVEAQKAWAQTSFRERIVVLRRAEEALAALGDEFVPVMQRETGALLFKANHEIDKTLGELRNAAQLPDQPSGEVLPHEDSSILSFARHVPVGVVGVIAPWNAPLMLAMRSIAPALALGNAVLVKPDIKTALSGGFLIARVFEEAGLPADLLHILPGGPETGEAVVKSRHTSVISFTGSSSAGRRVGEVAGGLLKRVVLELGGNNAFIVLDDANLDDAVENAIRGTFAHQGQICMATGRHLVHESIADEYVARLTRWAENVVLGDPTKTGVTLGPLIDERQATRVQEVVDASIGDGAVLRTGGTHEGPFFQPTVIDDVRPGNAAFDREIFGPVAPVTRFSTDEEAIELVGMSDYGLSAAIHSADLGRAMQIASRLRTGMVHVNGQTIADAEHIPMGGMGSSGNGGRYGGHWNIDEFTYTQWVTLRTPVKP